LPSTPAPTPTQGTLTPLDDNHTLERLTTSTKSVADYFKERLSAKAVGTCSSPPEEVTPRIGMGGASLNSRTFWASFQNTAGSSENHMISAVASVQHPVEASASQQEKHYSAEKKRKRSTESKAAESIGPLHEPDDGEKARGGAKKKRRKEEKGDVQDLEKARKKAERKAAKNARQET
jgi:Pin2-interacting protein X1